MANENAKRDENKVVTLLGVTDDSNAETRRLLIDPATGRLKVSASISIGLNDITDVTLTTPAQGDILYFNGTDWVNLPAGTSGQVLQTQGSGANPIWASISSGGVAGSDKQVQFNDAGVMGADDGLRYDKTQRVLYVRGFDDTDSVSTYGKIKIEKVLSANPTSVATIQDIGGATETAGRLILHYGQSTFVNSNVILTSISQSYIRYGLKLGSNGLEIQGSSSGSATLVTPATAGTTTLTLPASTDTLVGRATTDTLTNKTIDGNNNTITNLAHGAEVDNPTSGVHGVTGNVVGTSDTQTLTNKTITQPTLTIKQGTTPTAEGDIQWDATNDKIKIGDGVGTKTFSDDVYVLDRANHTGTQTLSTISDAGTMASQNANAVAITGGSISGITDLAVADGGTGASDATTARANLGVDKATLGYMTDLIDDTTPQLGGNLDMNGNNIQGVTPTEMGYLSGVTSSIQTQLNGKLANIVEDATPQLGGELDAQNNSIGFTLQTYTGVVGTTTIDWRNGNKAQFTFGAGNETLAFTAPSKPGNFVLIVVQDATGGRTITWPATVKWAGGTAPTLSTGANAVDIISFMYDGSSYYGVASLNFS